MTTTVRYTKEIFRKRTKNNEQKSRVLRDFFYFYKSRILMKNYSLFFLIYGI